jgi:acyl dehydratase
LTLRLGSWAELDAGIGIEVPSGAGWVTLTPEIVQRFSEVLEWDLCAFTGRAGRADRGDRAPGALSFVCGVKDYWHPGMPPRRLGELMHAPVPFLEIPAPGASAIGVSYEQESIGGLRIGEAATCGYTVLGYRQAETRLGPGAFIDVRANFRNPDGAELVRATWTIFRYTPHGRPSGRWRAEPCREPQREPVHVSEINLDLQRLVMWAGVIRDFAPLHFDRRFARAAGAPDAFANTQFVLALYERALAEAFAPELRIKRIGPFRMTGFATCDTVVRTFVSEPEACADGSRRTQVWQECDGRLTANGEASLLPVHDP